MQIWIDPLFTKVLIYLHCTDSAPLDIQLATGRVREAGATNYGLKTCRHCTHVFNYTRNLLMLQTTLKASLGASG